MEMFFFRFSFSENTPSGHCHWVVIVELRRQPQDIPEVRIILLIIKLIRKNQKKEKIHFLLEKKEVFEWNAMRQRAITSLLVVFIYICVEKLVGGGWNPTKTYKRWGQTMKRPTFVLTSVMFVQQPTVNHSKSNPFVICCDCAHTTNR